MITLPAKRPPDVFRPWSGCYCDYTTKLTRHLKPSIDAQTGRDQGQKTWEAGVAMVTRWECAYETERECEREIKTTFITPGTSPQALWCTVCSDGTQSSTCSFSRYPQISSKKWAVSMALNCHSGRNKQQNKLALGKRLLVRGRQLCFIQSVSSLTPTELGKWVVKVKAFCKIRK